MKKATNKAANIPNLFDLMNQVTPDEEGFLSAEQEPDCELRVYSAAGEVTDDGTSQ